MTEAIKAYVNERFEKVRAPKIECVKLLKREMVKRLVVLSRYFVRHGLNEKDAVDAAIKTLPAVKAPIRAALKEQKKNENAHSRVKAIVVFLAMICLVMSPFPIVRQLKFGFVFALGLIAFGVVLLIYSSRSIPKEVDVESICDRFEIGIVTKKKPQKDEPVSNKPQKKAPAAKNVREEEEEEFSSYEPRKTVYSMTSKMFVFAAIGAYVLAGLVSGKWLICLMIFPICFSITRLAKAFTDFFKGTPDDEDEKSLKKGASR